MISELIQRTLNVDNFEIKLFKLNDSPHSQGTIMSTFQSPDQSSTVSYQNKFSHLQIRFKLLECPKDRRQLTPKWGVASFSTNVSAGGIFNNMVLPLNTLTKDCSLPNP